MRVAVFTATMLGWCAPAFAADDPFAGLNLETHGFVSFGYLKSWGNNWHGETLDGTDEFWEAAGNVIARPMDHLRLGAQLFVRDLGEYGNGKVELDWAYADWRAVDAIGLQVGRVKMPFGLFCESLDVDAGRTSIFLPVMYPTRAREILLSTDGGKLYGTVGDFDWALYGGQRQLQDDGDFASYFAYRFGLDSVDSIEADSVFGGMLHWYTPVDGLAARLSLARLDELDLTGTMSGGGCVGRPPHPLLVGGDVLAHLRTWARHRLCGVPAILRAQPARHHQRVGYFTGGGDQPDRFRLPVVHLALPPVVVVLRLG